MSSKAFKEARDWWREHPREFSQLPLAEKLTVLYRYGLGVGGQETHSLENVATLFGVSTQVVSLRLKRAKLRADRTVLLQAGPAMQLIPDHEIVTIHIKLPAFDDRLLRSLRHQQLNTLNQLLDKSARWLNLVGMTQTTVSKLREVLAKDGLYLRGEVPTDAEQRTSLRHRITRR